MKRAITLILTVSLIATFFSMNIYASEDSGSLDNFSKQNTYVDGRFTDVSDSDWFSENVSIAYELGLMNGNSDSGFDVESNITIAETLTISARMRSIYLGDQFDFTDTSPWYECYVSYCIDQGIIYAGQFSDYNVSATRAEFATILANTLPIEELDEINSVEDNSIPDVDMDSDYSEEVYMLYRAGILTGNDTEGTYTPEAYISRAAASAIVTRISVPILRKNITLTAPCDHNWDDGTIVVDATCTSDGTKIFTCSLCGEEKIEEIPATGHTMVNNVCSECGYVVPINISMSAAEAVVAKTINYISNRSIQYKEYEEGFVLLFALQDSEYNNLAAPAIVKMEIVNDNGEIVYSGKKVVETSDFGNWSNAFGTDYLGAVYIYDDEIEAGSTDSGTITFTVENEGYFYFSEWSLNISGDLPLKETTIVLPSVPTVTKYSSSYSNKTYSKCMVTDISYTMNGDNLYIYFTGEKVYDINGDDGDWNCAFDWKLYDSEGYVFDSGTVLVRNLLVGEKFKDEKETVFDLTIGETYLLEITDKN